LPTTLNPAPLYTLRLAWLHCWRASPRVPPDELVEQAMEFLQKALNCGYGRDKAATDPDLKQLRSNSRFARLIDATSAK